MAYDSARGVAVLYGGGPPVASDTWTWDGTVWTQVAIGAPSPGPRQQHGMTFDSARGRVVLYGGGDGIAVKSDTWEWDGAAWKLMATSGPGPRYSYALAYDAGRERTVLFGGYTTSSGNAQADTWEWDGSTWQQVATTGPSVRGFAAMAYDALRGRVVLYGGAGAGVALSDTWEWDGSQWTQIATSGGPGPRQQHAMATDNGGSRVLLYGGRNGSTTTHADTWLWNGTAWTQATATGPGPRSFFTMTYDDDRSRVVLFGGFGAPGDTWEWSSPCDDEAAVLDREGNVVFPDSWDPSEPVTYEDVDQNLGDVENLYTSANGLDTWYPQLICNPSIGGTVPPEASDPDLTAGLAAQGIVGVTPQEIADGLQQLQEVIADKAAQEVDPLPTAGPLVSGGYNPPAAPHCKESGCGYVLGGRDIVFIHGLRMDPLFDKIFGTNPGALTTWPNDKAAFYGNGYWKQGAERYWADHIKRFFTDRGIKNRYLIIAYPSTQRLEAGVQAILTQIADAMKTGEGVIDPTGRNDKSGFGTPSFVVVSHSTGGLITDVAMAAAANHPNLGVDFIPRFCKGHIALNAAFSGSRQATAAIALSGYLTFVNPPPGWLCPVANVGILALNELGSNNPTLSCPPNYLVLATSLLVDLVPLVTQNKWGNYVKSTPVRTLTVVGGHPSYLSPLKNILHPGFDDGVTTMESQVGNPNSVLLGPSGFNPSGLLGQVRVFDMGVFRTYPLRAIGYYLDQVAVDHFLNPLSLIPHPGLAAGGPTPYVSPTGMVQPVGSEYSLTGGFNPLRRYPNHFSFILSAADHFGGSTGLSHSAHPDGWNGVYYRNTFGEHNLEETRVLTDPAVYQPYAMVYPGDDEPLLKPGQAPGVEEIVRGRKVHFKIKIFGKKFEKTWWIWKRRYHLLADWQNKVQMDYVYSSVLTQGLPPCPPPTATNDCNHNGVADICDLSNGTSRDCNGNRLPDECEVIVAPGILLQPASQMVTAGQTVTFTVGVTGTGPFNYQWRKNGINLANGGTVSGATTNILKISPAAAANAGSYDVVATSGCGQVTSGKALLTVKPAGPSCELDPGLAQAGNTAPVAAVLAQTFRPAKDGVLTRILHGLRNAGGSSAQSYNLYVTTTQPNGQPSWPGGVLYSAKGLTVFASGSGVDGAVTVVNGPKISTATTYALVLEPVSPGQMYWRGNSGAGSYPKGSAYRRNGTQWTPTSIGPKDFGFKLEGSCCQPAVCVLDPGLSQTGNTFARAVTLAQTFKPTQGGALTQIVHGLRKGSSSASKYNLYLTTTNANGQPSWPGGVLYSVKGLSTFASGTGIDAKVPVPGGIQLSASITYALILEPAGAGDMYWRGNSGAGSYPNGAGYEWKAAAKQWALTATGPKDHGFRVEGTCCK